MNAVGRYEFSVSEKIERKGRDIKFLSSPDIEGDYEIIDNIMSGISKWADENDYVFETDYNWGEDEESPEFDIFYEGEQILSGKVSYRNINEKGGATGPKRRVTRWIKAKVSGEIEAEGPEMVKRKEEDLEEWIYAQAKTDSRKLF